MTTFAILAYDGIEPIDIGATYGVLSMAKRVAPDLAFFVVAKDVGEVVMANGLRLVADHGFDDCPTFDILMVLGGPGWVDVCNDARTLAFINAAANTEQPVASVCTGGMILAAAGLLKDRIATTKSEVFPGETSPLDLMTTDSTVANVQHARIVDDGSILTGGGVSLGIDMTLHLLARHCSAEIASETARVLEYSAAWQANAERLPDLIHNR
ncbi:MAG: DJ-1/PfpI family protein [Hyphomicrobiales bacterium]|nr:DJ-1/PfpI family protein [Hyphomicrobiales bacterium]